MGLRARRPLLCYLTFAALREICGTLWTTLLSGQRAGIQRLRLGDRQVCLFQPRHVAAFAVQTNDFAQVRLQIDGFGCGQKHQYRTRFVRQSVSGRARSA